MIAKAFRWLDRACLPLMGVLSALVALLNYHATHNFQHDREAPGVQGAHSPRLQPGRCDAELSDPTDLSDVGLWLVLLLTTSKPVLIALQIAVGLCAVWCLLSALDAIELLDRWSMGHCASC